jgi:GNAT superfamily N-acetyltransferase
MQFVDLALSKRLERAEGHACLQFAVARKNLFPECGAEWIECGGAYAVFDTVESPVTQTFGLGLFEPLTPATLDTIERFFRDRSAPVMHEVSPLAGVPTYDLLCARNYRPMEISNILYRPIEPDSSMLPPNISVRVVGPDEGKLWMKINARGWASLHPEYQDFFLQMGEIVCAREGSFCFLAEVEGEVGAAGALSIYDGVALFGGATTVPELRRRGLQSALLQARLRYAHEHGCDLAMIAAEPGGESQRNAERRGFRVAYTRVKWKLQSEQ